MSLYFYAKGLPSHHQHKIIKDMNVSEYLEWCKTDLHQQIEFILDDNGVCLIDNIIDFDNLNSNLIEFFDKRYNLDIKPFMPNRKLNPSKRSEDYKIYYNDNDKKLISEMHAPDIDYFDFKFE